MTDDAKRRLVGGIILAGILIVIAVLISDGEQPDEPAPSTLQLQLDAARDAGNEEGSTQTLNLEMPPPREEPADENYESMAVDLPPPEPIRGASDSSGEAANSSTDSSATQSQSTASAEPARPASPIPRPAPKPASPAPTPKPQPAPATQTASAPPPSPTPPAADGDWAVQVGSFSDAANAQRLRAELASKGYPAFVRQAQVNGVTVNRVRVGPFRTEVGAQQLAARLSADMGQPVKVLRDR